MITFYSMVYTNQNMSIIADAVRMIIIRRAIRYIKYILFGHKYDHQINVGVNDTYYGMMLIKCYYEGVITKFNINVMSNTKHSTMSYYDESLIEKLIRACWCSNDLTLKQNVPSSPNQMCENMRPDINYCNYYDDIVLLRPYKTYNDNKSIVLRASCDYAGMRVYKIDVMRNLLILKNMQSGVSNDILDKMVDNSYLAYRIKHNILVLNDMCKNDMMIKDVLIVMFNIMLEVM